MLALSAAKLLLDWPCASLWLSLSRSRTLCCVERQELTRTLGDKARASGGEAGEGEVVDAGEAGVGE